MKQKHIFVIAEAGVNHNGELKKAFDLVDIASWAGADAVKFQTFKPGECTGRFAIKVEYLKKASFDCKTRYDLTRKLALPFGDFLKIQKYAKRKRITFLTTPDGNESLEFVDKVLDVPMIKVSSTEVTHLRFLEAVAKTEKPVILSTGLSTMEEVRTALKVMQKYNKDITLLHCVSEYPALAHEVNLNAMVNMKRTLGVKVGYSDHTLGIEAGIAAAALGASVIEKHFTIDLGLPGPDHKASLDKNGLRTFVEAIRKTESMLGDGIKRPSLSELKNINGIRRSIVAARTLKKGIRISAGDFTYKRPGYGIHPYDHKKIIGKTLLRDLVEDEPFKWPYLK